MSKKKKFDSNSNNTKKQYLVALEISGILMQPNIFYRNFLFVTADNSEEAENIYNLEKNDSEYFRGRCIGELSEDRNKIFLSNYLKEKILALDNIKILDDEDIYLFAQTDGKYFKNLNNIYHNFHVVKNNQHDITFYQINAFCSIAKYNKEKQTFEVSIHYIDMVEALVNECNKKTLQKIKYLQKK